MIHLYLDYLFKTFYKVLISNLYIRGIFSSNHCHDLPSLVRSYGSYSFKQDVTQRYLFVFLKSHHLSSNKSQSSKFEVSLVNWYYLHFLGRTTFLTINVYDLECLLFLGNLCYFYLNGSIFSVRSHRQVHQNTFSSGDGCCLYPLRRRLSDKNNTESLEFVFSLGK